MTFDLRCLYIKKEIACSLVQLILFIISTFQSLFLLIRSDFFVCLYNYNNNRKRPTHIEPPLQSLQINSCRDNMHFCMSFITTIIKGRDLNILNLLYNLYIYIKPPLHSLHCDPCLFRINNNASVTICTTLIVFAY